MQTQENITVIDETVMPSEVDRCVRELLCICFPSDVEVFSETRHWHGSAPEYSVVACRAGRALGHVGVVVRTILDGDIRKARRSVPAGLTCVRDGFFDPSMGGYRRDSQPASHSRNSRMETARRRLAMGSRSFGAGDIRQWHRYDTGAIPCCSTSDTGCHRWLAT